MSIIKHIRTVVLMILLGGVIFVSGLKAQTYTTYPLGITAMGQDITADKNGNLHMVWVNGGMVYYGRVVNFRVTNQVQLYAIAAGETNYCRPRIAVRSDGQTVHLVWGDSTLTHAWRDSAGVWRKETVRNAVTNRRYHGPICAVTPDETVHILYQFWNATQPATPMIYIRKPSGGAWSADMSLVPNAAAEYRDPAVFVDSYGGLHATWRGLLVSPSAPYLYAPAGTNLENAAVAYPPMASDVTHNAKGDLFVNEETGRVHRPIGAWTKRSSIVIDYSYKDLGVPFAALTRPSIGDLVTTADSNPTVAADTLGHVFVSFRDFVGGKTVVYLSIFNDGAWTKYVLDPNAGTTYNEHIKSVLTATEAGVFGTWRSLSGEVILAAAMIPPPSSSITVSSPNNNEGLASGSSQTITWTTKEITGNVDLYLYRNFKQVGVIATGVPAVNGSCAWTVGSYQGGVAASGPGYKIRIRTSDGRFGDFSNGAFTISGTANQVLTVTSPDGGESLGTGTVRAITWSAPNVTGNVDIYLDRNGSRLGTIATGVAASAGTYSWTVGSYQGGTAPVGDGYKITIKGTSGQPQDSSNAAFSLTSQQSPLAVTAPAGGESWIIGSTQLITWSASGVSGGIDIYLYKGTSNLGLIASAIPVGNASYSWKAGYLKSGAKVAVAADYTVSIVSVVNRTVTAKSGSAFSLVTPSLRVTAPLSGASWKLNSIQEIKWASTGLTGVVDIFLNRSGAVAGQIADDIPVEDGSYSWTVGSLIGRTIGAGTCSIFIRSVSTGLVAWGGGTFSLVNSGTPTPTPVLTVISPNGGESLVTGSVQSITWSSANVTGNVNIYLDRNGARLGTIATGIAASAGRLSWTAGSYQGGTAPIGTGYKITIMATTGQPQDSSNAAFSLAGQRTFLSVTAPNGGAVWRLNSIQQIRWASSGLTGVVDIYLNRNGAVAGQIADDVPVTNGSFSWTVGRLIGRTIGAGTSSIFIKSVSTGLVAWGGGTFSIVN